MLLRLWERALRRRGEGGIFVRGVKGGREGGGEREEGGEETGGENPQETIFFGPSTSPVLSFLPLLPPPTFFSPLQQPEAAGNSRGDMLSWSKGSTIPGVCIGGMVGSGKEHCQPIG